MGILGLFRKLMKEKKVEEIVVEKLAFSDVGSWVGERIKEIEGKQEKVILMIKEIVKRHIGEIKEKIKILEDFDVDAKRGPENVKGIVKSSREDYIKLVEKLLGTLNGIEMNEFEKSTKKIDKLFADFNKSSYRKYERATILIGKEMLSLKEGVRGFSKELTKTFEESKDVVDSFKEISSVKSKLDMISSVESTLGKINETMLSFNKRIKSKEEENKKLLEEIEKIKKSTDYLECLETKKKIETLKEEEKNEISKLKQLIDFKALANFFHIFPDQMSVLKAHKEDFQGRFQKDKGEVMMDLLDRAKLNKDTISEKVSLIRNKIEERAGCEKGIKDDETLKLYPKIEGAVMEIANLKIERDKEEKRGEKVKVNKKELIDSLKQELGKINVEVKD